MIKVFSFSTILLYMAQNDGDDKNNAANEGGGNNKNSGGNSKNSGGGNEKNAGGGGEKKGGTKKEEPVVQPHPVKEQLPGVQYCINSPPPWR